MPVFQSTFTHRNDIAVAGMFSEAFDDRRVSGKVARGLVTAGYGVFKVPTVGGSGTPNMVSPGLAFHRASPAIAADVDAIITAITSSTSIQTFSGATLNGVVGATEMQPARTITLVLSNHADWDATNATLVGVNHLGQTVTETLAIPNGGNATVTSTTRFKTVTSLAIPVQAGTGGTATVGISALTSGLALVDFLGIAVRQPVKSGVFANSLYGYPGITSTSVEAHYVDGETVPVLTKGGIWVVTEEAVSDQDPVYVRIASGAGGSILGAFRNDDDSSSCVVVTGARFTRDSTSGLAPLQFRLV